MIKILEMAWLTIAVVSSMVAIYQFFEDWQSAIWMVFVTAVSLVMYGVRHRQRLRIEQQERDAGKYH